MCHLILLGPIVGLAVFWIWPLALALPAYLVILTGSLVAYVAVVRAMQRPVLTGRRGLEHQRGVVVSAFENGEAQVRLHGEIWHAVSDEQLRPGERVEVLATEPGLIVRVTPERAERRSTDA